jgi:hypothetical protein
MSDDRERGPDDGPADQSDKQSEVTSDATRREALGRFAKCTTPAMVALLAGTRLASASVEISDVRVKRDVTRVGRLPNGLGLYRYRYLWSDTFFVGVMAQEVAAVDRAAVMRGADSYLQVDYARLGLRLQTWDEWVAAA